MVYLYFAMFEQAWFQEDFGEWIPVSFVTIGAREYSSVDALQVRNRNCVVKINISSSAMK